MGVKWYELVSSWGDDGVIYQGDSYCSSCGEKIKEELNKKGKAPEDPTDEHSFDSDDYPKYANWDDQESDTPQHCGSHEHCMNYITLPCGSKIGAWLGGSLTNEGTSYVEKKVREDMLRSNDHSRQVGRLWRYLYRDQLENDIVAIEPDEVKHGLTPTSHPALYKGLDRESNKDKTFVHPYGFFSDLDAIYAIGVKPVGRSERVASVYSSETDELGNFDSVQSATVSKELHTRAADALEIVTEVASDEGWR